MKRGGAPHGRSVESVLLEVVIHPRHGSISDERSHRRELPRVGLLDVAQADHRQRRPPKQRVSLGSAAASLRKIWLARLAD